MAGAVVAGLLLQLLFLTPSLDSVEYRASRLIDARYLATVADSFHVPHEVVYVVAWQETRAGNARHLYARGPGRAVLRSNYRVCREVGRMQLSPCNNWVRMLNDYRCTTRGLFRYTTNVHCGVANLARLHVGTTWREAIRRFNGGGPLSYRYLKAASVYLAAYHLNQLEYFHH